MKKAIIFIIGIIVGAVLCFVLTSGDNDTDIQQMTTGETTTESQQEYVYNEGVSYDSDEVEIDKETEKKVLAVAESVLCEEPMYISMLDINDDGNGIAVVCHTPGMSKLCVAFLKTENAGESWTPVKDEESYFSNGSNRYIFLDERLIMISQSPAAETCEILISDDYGVTWKNVNLTDLIEGVDIEIPEDCSNAYFNVLPILISEDEEENTFTLAFMSGYNMSILHIAKYDYDVNILEEYYINRTGLAEAVAGKIN